MKSNSKRKGGNRNKKSSRYSKYVNPPMTTAIPSPPREWTIPSPPKKWTKTTRKNRNKRVRKTRKVKTGGLGPSPPLPPPPKNIDIKILFLPDTKPEQYYSVSLRVNDIPGSLGKNINMNNTFDDNDKFFFEQTEDTFDEFFKNEVSIYYPHEENLQTATQDFFKNYTEICEVKEINRGIPHYTRVFIENAKPMRSLKEMAARAVMRNQNKDKKTQELLKDNNFLNVHPSLKYLPCRKLPVNDKDVGAFERDWDVIF